MLEVSNPFENGSRSTKRKGSYLLYFCIQYTIYEIHIIDTDSYSVPTLNISSQTFPNGHTLSDRSGHMEREGVGSLRSFFEHGIYEVFMEMEMKMSGLCLRGEVGEYIHI